MGRIATESTKSAESKHHASTAIYLQQYDYPRFAVTPTTEVMIATTPRAGSTYVCLQLWRTGVLGAPLEYANFRLLNRIPRWSSLLSDKTAFWNEVKAVRTSPNGVYGYKFFVQTYSSLLREAPDLIPMIAPSHVIYLTREDLLGQAISYHKAVESGTWFSGASRQSRAVEFRTDKIKERYQAIRRQMLRWEYVFLQTNAHILRITYEEMLRDPVSCTARVIQHVHGDHVTLQPRAIPELGIQRDQESGKWKTLLRDAVEEWSAETVTCSPRVDLPDTDKLTNACN